MKNTQPYITGMVIAAVISGGGLFALNKLPSGRVATALASAVQPSSTPAVDTPVRTVDTTAMDAQIAKLLQDNPSLDASITITDIESGKTYQYGDTAAFQAASVTKLLTAALYLHNVEDGSLSLDDTIGTSTAGTLLEGLIVDSDNDAWSALNNVLTEKGLETYANDQGLASYDASLNIITSQDTAALLTKLYKRQLLNEVNTDLLLSYMEQAGYSEYIPAAIPAGVTVYHKAGFLDDRFNDAAIVDDGKHAYVLAIFSKAAGTYDPAQGKALFHAVAKAANETFLTIN
jgi:beta-lactamase class A